MYLLFLSISLCLLPLPVQGEGSEIKVLSGGQESESKKPSEKQEAEIKVLTGEQESESKDPPGEQETEISEIKVLSGGQESENEGPGADAYWDEVLSIQKSIRRRDVLKYGMTPVYGQDIADGVYSVEGVSNSKFFKIADAQLIVAGGNMTARITIPSMSYLYVYPGTGKEAASDRENWIGFQEVEKQTVFTIPVEALNKEIDCAAFSKARKKWYDRKLVFDAATLPEEAVAFPVPDYELIGDAIKAYGNEDEDYLAVLAGQDARNARNMQEEDPDAYLLTGTPEPVEIDYPDGEYSIEVNMLGGSGRASISSPTLLIVRDGKAYAKLLWSSAHYDYMVIGSETFYNQTTDGGISTFEIPIVVMDETIPVIADTTAMGDPVEIRYELSFYSMTIGPKGNIPQEAAKKVLIIAAAILVGGGILNFIVKRKRKA